MADYCVWVWSDNGRLYCVRCGQMLRWVWSDYRMLVWQGWSLQHTVLRAMTRIMTPYTADVGVAWAWLTIFLCILHTNMAYLTKSQGNSFAV